MALDDGSLTIRAGRRTKGRGVRRREATRIVSGSVACIMFNEPLTSSAGLRFQSPAQAAVYQPSSIASLRAADIDAADPLRLVRGVALQEWRADDGICRDGSKGRRSRGLPIISR